MIAIQWNPEDLEGNFSTVHIPEPVVPPPLRQMLVPDDTVIDGMRLDLNQDPPVLVPIEEEQP